VDERLASDLNPVRIGICESMIVQGGLRGGFTNKSIDTVLFKLKQLKREQLLSLDSAIGRSILLKAVVLGRLVGLAVGSSRGLATDLAHLRGSLMVSSETVLG
jgi:hypothetical protein